jgi:phage tail sheath protein FI
MSKYLWPGVYTPEVPMGGEPLQMVGTSAAVFIITAEWGPMNDATLVTSWTQFVKMFGNDFANGYGAYAARDFFRMGGEQLYVVRICHYTDITDPETLTAVKANATFTDDGEGGEPTAGYHTGGAGPMVDMVDAENKFKIAVDEDAVAHTVTCDWTECDDGTKIAAAMEAAIQALGGAYAAVTVDFAEDVYVITSGTTGHHSQVRITRAASLDCCDELQIAELGEDTDGTGGTLTDLFEVTGKYYGTYGNSLKVTVDDVDVVAHTFTLLVYYTYDNGTQKLLERYTGLTLDETDTENFIEDRINDTSLYIQVEQLADGDPEETSTTLASGSDGLASIADADYIGDEASASGLYALDKIDQMLAICHPGITASDVIVNGLNYVINNVSRRQIDIYVCDLPLGLTPQEAEEFTSDYLASTGYEAIYYPWIVEGVLEKPVAPYMCGVYADNDNTYGVWAAPAGVEYPLPITRAVYDVSIGEGQLLNSNGINCIKRIPDEGIVPWGVRTLDVQTHFRYLNVRRFVNAIKKTLQDGGVQFVFKLNGPDLWRRIEDTARMMLMTYHSLGAFAGKTPAESFYAKCDATTNPDELVDQGICTCIVGICPVKPAEFIEFPIQIYNTGALPISDSVQE